MNGLGSREVFDKIYREVPCCSPGARSSAYELEVVHTSGQEMLRGLKEVKRSIREEAQFQKQLSDEIAGLERVNNPDLAWRRDYCKERLNARHKNLGKLQNFAFIRTDILCLLGRWGGYT